MPEETLGYGVVRFSGKRQEEGDSKRRQSEWVEEVCKREGWKLIPLYALGISAFRGKHLRYGDLAAFVDKAKAGEIRKGSVLLIERIDRLDRRKANRAMKLWLELLERGIRIQTRWPEALYTEESSGDLMGLLMPLVEMIRSHQESQAKRERLQEACARRRQRARDDKTPVILHGPDWLRWNGKGWEEIPERVRVLERMAELRLSGHGSRLIARILNEEGYPTWEKAGGRLQAQQWRVETVAAYLRKRSLVGYYQPHVVDEDGKYVPAGEEIPDYYPKVLDLDVFRRIQKLMDSQKRGGRPQGGAEGAGVASLLSGLCRHEPTGDRMCLITCTNRRAIEPRQRYLVVSRKHHAGAAKERKGLSCRHDPVERAVLSMLAGMKEVAHEKKTREPDDDDRERLRVLEERIASCKARIADPAVKCPEAYWEQLEDLYLAKRRLERSRRDSAAPGRLRQPVIDYLRDEEAMSAEERTAARRRLKTLLAGAVGSVDLRIVPTANRLVRRVFVTLRMKDGRVRQVELPEDHRRKRKD